MNLGQVARYAIILPIAVLIVGLCGCEELVSILSSGESIESSGDVITIGIVLPLTGRLADSAGTRLKHGFALAREEVNSSPRHDFSLEFITEDDQGTVEGAVNAFNKLIGQDGVPVIIGPTTSGQAREAFSIAQQNRVVALSSTSNASGLSAIGDFNFRVSLALDKRADGLVRMTQQKLGYQRVAKIVDSDDFFSQNGDALLTEALNSGGVDILPTETFQTGDTDFSAALTRIKEQSPDAIFISALPPDITEIVIQGRRLGISRDIPFIVLQLSLDEVRTAGDAAEGLITSSSWDVTVSTPENQAFIQNYRAKYGIEANTWAAQAYASVKILAKGIIDAQSTDAAAIRDALANIRDFDTVLGAFSFDSHGDAVYPPIALIVKNGKLEVFE